MLVIPHPPGGRPDWNFSYGEDAFCSQSCPVSYGGRLHLENSLLPFSFLYSLSFLFSSAFLPPSLSSWLGSLWPFGHFSDPGPCGFGRSSFPHMHWPVRLPPPGVFSGKEAGGVLYCQQQQPGALVKEALLLLHWAEDHLLLLKAEHLAGTLNITTDWLSRQQLSKMEWQLHPEVFQSW